ncbi:chalcone isomerase family protein [Halobacteriovorax sp.]|uniref:chalcone isomerase family protein n=1 Tax=Halobacteriovorax sp. TaxID=2020862 RepID=UPI003AF27F0C
MNKLLILVLLFPMLVMAKMDKDFKLVGEGVLSYYFWDVYKVSYFKSIVSDDELIKITYLRDVERKHSQAGWDESLGKLKGVEKQLEWLKNNAVDVKEGDVLAIYKLNGSDVIIQKNGETISSKKDDKKLFSIVHSPWIGPQSVDEDLKEKLIKGN